MEEISVSLGQANGELLEWKADEVLLLKCRTLRSQGASGRELIGHMTEVDPGAPPLSMRLAGVDAEGESFEEFICY